MRSFYRPFACLDSEFSAVRILISSYLIVLMTNAILWLQK